MNVTDEMVEAVASALFDYVQDRDSRTRGGYRHPGEEVPTPPTWDADVPESLRGGWREKARSFLSAALAAAPAAEPVAWAVMVGGLIAHVGTGKQLALDQQRELDAYGSTATVVPLYEHPERPTGGNQ